jgi:hypothetical protein
MLPASQDPAPAARGLAYVIATDGLQTTGDLEASGFKAFAQATQMDPQTLDKLSARIASFRQSVLADPQLASRFKEDPLAVLVQLHPSLRAELPGLLLRGVEAQLDSAPCRHSPSGGAYDSCAQQLLQRVAQWIAQGPENEAAFHEDPDAAVDAVAGRSPREAVALTKAALQRARRIP